MKRKKDLYVKMCDKEQIERSIRAAAKGKKNRRAVQRVLADIPKHVDIIYNMLTTESYVPAVPWHKIIWDSCSNKERDLGIVPFFPDTCIQRLVVDVAKDAVFMSHMYPYSCASIPKRGSALAKRYFERALKCKENTTYALKLDISKYYPSIKPEIVMKKLEKKVKDKKWLKIVHDIITSDPKEEGLNIGFYINQWLANFILEELDWIIYRRNGVKYYARNMDDMIIVGSNKKYLERALARIERELWYMHLKLKEHRGIFNIDKEGIDFVGYRFFHGFTILRKRNSLRIQRRIRRMEKKQKNGWTISFREASGLLSLIGQLKHVANYTFTNKYVNRIDQEPLRGIVRRKQRKLRACQTA